MYKVLFFFILSFLYIPYSTATHIVGGELQLSHISGTSYTLALNLYFDDINGAPTSKDPSVDISAFSKSNNALLAVYDVPLSSDVYVSNINASCSDASVRTRIIRYVKTIQLDPALFHDPSGFYFSWERCCRNSTITNIQNPSGTGEVFYLEFPALSTVNSSPVFHGLNNIYGCIGQPFYFDFGADDADGDSLAYSIRTPLAGHSTATDLAPVGMSAPYDSAVWQPSYNVSSSIAGTPPLSIDKNTGELFVIPSQAGLFVFAVQCQEFRNGIKIGEVRREYQIYIHACAAAYAPDLKLKKPDQSYYQKGDTLKVDMHSSGCYPLSVTDSTWSFLGNPEEISWQIISQAQPNIALSVNSLLLKINVANDTGHAMLCMTTSCTKGQFNYRGIYKYTLIAKDKTCPVPLTDTLELVFLITPDTNHLPRIFPLPKSRTVNLFVGESYSLQIYGTDTDSSDMLNLSARGADAGMSFNIISGKDSISSLFSWTPTCDNFKNGSAYHITFTIKDDHCIDSGKDTLQISFVLADHYYPFVFNPSNLITPNKDGLNDFFEIPDLPLDYCGNEFVKVEIFNRWGAKVFETHRRDFKWNPEKESDGMYYLVVSYSSNVFKSWVQVIK
ncbi:MAG: gliding motility-associated C-terminal domain-containing protein [Cytophagaceae bacterium]